MKSKAKKVVVVTGASSGMGKEFVLQIANKVNPDEIWVIARRKDKLLELKGLVSVPIKLLCLDLTKKEDLQRYKNVLKKKQPSIRILANCAGYGKLNHYENEDLDTYMNMIDLNIKAMVTMINHSLPYMRKGAKILNLDSSSAFQPLPYVNVYAATKAFILSYSRALNRELAYRGIHVLAVCPYWVRTQFYDRAIDPEQKKAIIHYGVIAGPEAVMEKAIIDLYRNKDISAYGVLNKIQILLAKILPHSMVMNWWMWYQDLDGTRDIREENYNI